MSFLPRALLTYVSATGQPKYAMDFRTHVLENLLIETHVVLYTKEKMMKPRRSCPLHSTVRSVYFVKVVIGYL